MRDTVEDVLASEWFLHQNQLRRVGRSTSSAGPESGAVLWCVQLCTDMHHSWLLQAVLGLPEPWGMSVQPQPCRGSSMPACFISKHMNIALEHHIKGMV